jgi:hypothetical protein
MIFSKVESLQLQSSSPGLQYLAAAALTHGVAQSGIFSSRALQSFAAEATATKVAIATGTENFILKAKVFWL